MKKFLSKYKYYLVVALIVVVVFVALVFNIDDKHFYKDILEWKVESDKQYKKTVLEEYKKADKKDDKKVKEIEKEIEQLEERKQKAKKEIDEKDIVEVGKMFKDMGY